jgi:hypothetical protein
MYLINESLRFLQEKKRLKAIESTNKFSHFLLERLNKE